MRATRTDDRETTKGFTHAQRSPLRGVAGALAAALAVGIAGCGDDNFANDPRAATPITVSAVITPRGIEVSPPRFGAGTIELLASNQTATSQRLRLRSRRAGEGADELDQSTGPISPGGTASLKADIDPGTYLVSVGSPAMASVRVVVGAERESAQDRVLQP